MPLKPNKIQKPAVNSTQGGKGDLNQIKKNIMSLSKKKGISDLEYFDELRDLVYDTDFDEEKKLYKIFYETRKKSLLGSIPKAVYDLPQEDVISLNSDVWENDKGATIYVGTKEKGILDLNWLLDVAKNSNGLYYLWVSSQGLYGLTVEVGKSGYAPFNRSSFDEILEEMSDDFIKGFESLKPDIKEDGTIAIKEYDRLSKYLDKLLELDTGDLGSAAWCTLKIEKDRSLKLQCWTR